MQQMCRGSVILQAEGRLSEQKFCTADAELASCCKKRFFVGLLIVSVN